MHRLMGKSLRNTLILSTFLVASFAFVPALLAQTSLTTPLDQDMELRIEEALSDVTSYLETATEEELGSAEDPQWEIAREFFEYSITHPDTPTTQRASNLALEMWQRLRDMGTFTPRRPNRNQWAQELLLPSNAYADPRDGHSYASDDHLLEVNKVALNTLAKQSKSIEIFRQWRRDGYNDDEFSIPMLGSTAPNFNIRTIDGKRLSLYELRGKIVVLEFWSIHCEPCATRIPNLKALLNTTPSDKFVIIGITLDQDEEQLTNYLHDNDIRWHQVASEIAWSHQHPALKGIPSTYHLSHLPKSYLIDEKGVIIGMDLSPAVLTQRVKGLLATDR